MEVVYNNNVNQQLEHIMAKSSDLSGARFGRLVASCIGGLRGARRTWVCKCDCGKTIEVVTNRLTSGHTKSCGCLKAERGADNIAVATERRKTHGMTKTKIFSLWSSMIERCSNPNKDRYAGYGGRGIYVCDRWKVFENFYADMGERPEGHSLDRIDNDGPYSPENCRWAPIKTQNRNKQRTRFLVVGGVRKPLMAVADELGISKNAAQYFFSVLKRFDSLNLEVSCG